MRCFAVAGISRRRSSRALANISPKTSFSRAARASCSFIGGKLAGFLPSPELRVTGIAPRELGTSASCIPLRSPATTPVPKLYGECVRGPMPAGSCGATGADTHAGAGELASLPKPARALGGMGPARRVIKRQSEQHEGLRRASSHTTRSLLWSDATVSQGRVIPDAKHECWLNASRTFLHDHVLS